MIRFIIAISLALIFTAFLPAKAQIANNWAFNKFMGLTFNTAPPTTFSTSIRANTFDPDTFATRGASSISNCQGDLLFYTGGCDIWDSTHQLMTNGKLSCGAKKADASYIVPKPGSAKKYYVFYVARKSQPYNYAIVDMSQGHGKVTQKNQVIKGIPTQTALITVVEHANNKDYWLVVLAPKTTLKLKDWQFHIFPVTQKGIGKKQTFNVIFNNKGRPTNTNGTLKVTPNKQYLLTNLKFDRAGKRFVAARFPFDNEFGIIKNPVPKGLLHQGQIKGKAQIGTGIGGIATSPNNNFIYLTAKNNNFITLTDYSEIYQVENKPTQPYQSVEVVYTPKQNLFSQDLQLGANNKIYIYQQEDTKKNTQHLGVIENPNFKGKKANVQGKAKKLSVTSGLANLKFPRLYQPTPDINFNLQTPCKDTARFVNLTDTTNWQPYRRNSFQWKMGDGTTYTGYHQTLNHVYDTPGTYYVELGALDQCGNMTWQGDSITIHKPFYPGFQKDSVSYACGQAKLNLKDTSNRATSWQYRFRDVNISNRWQISRQAHPTFSTDTTGVFVTRQIASTANCADTQYRQDSIYIEQPPEARFQLKDTLGCNPYSVQLSDSSTYDSIENGFARWQLQPYSNTTKLYAAKVAGNTDTTLKLQDTGYYRVSLLAHNNQGCVDTLTRDSAVYITPHPQARVRTPVQAVCPKDTIDFQNQSRFSDTVNWQFGDGSQSSMLNPKHAYQKTGYYDVTVAASNGTCWDTTTYDSLVQVNPTPEPGFTLQYDQACTPLDVAITSKAKGQIDSIRYDFGNGISKKANNPQITYKREDSFTIRQTVYNTYGCVSQDSMQLTVFENPQADYTVSDSLVFCHEKAFDFKNQSRPEKPRLDEGLLYDWYFGQPEDSVITDTQENPVQRYSREGDYPVQLVTTNGLCKDSLEEFLKVRLRQKPILDFSVSDTTLCTPATIHLDNATQHADSFVWRLGDGTELTGKQPEYTYQAPGKYDLQLQAFTREGCRDTLTKRDYIQVKAQPEADFSFSPKAGCTPLKISFQNQSRPDSQAQFYTWTFGTGDTLTKTSPAYTYQNQSPGTYPVTLTADNGYCRDTQTRQVEITGFGGQTHQPQLSYVTVPNNENISLDWEPQPDAKQYEIRKKQPQGSWQALTTTSETTYTDQQVNVHKQRYHYRIRAIDSCDNRSKASNSGRNILLQGNSQGNELADLWWNPYQTWFNGVRHYRLAKAAQPSDFNNLAQTADTAYQDGNYFKADRDSQYYRVKAIRQGNPKIQSTSNILALPYEPRVFVPNAFSPNGDGHNDVFKPTLTGVYHYTLKIYNRWGQELFHTTDPEAGWDGTFEGQKAPAGIYVYTVYATGNFGHPIKRQGTVRLIR